MNSTIDNDTLATALNLSMNMEGEIVTIRDFLHHLLVALWHERDGFNSKRPFGSDGWEYDLYFPLVAAGIIDGEIDTENGWLDSVDEAAGDDFVKAMITMMCYGAYNNKCQGNQS